ncbi:MAG: MlaD family protein [Desulfovibrio sp.]|jgi:phospholipid/cholesterol/gamma-HCH transport system substrate-binding protein|nr:MlaD family protein [Desulfovibrio sp.]
MEVSARYFLIGLFALGLSLAGVLFILWTAGNQGEPMTSYDIRMRENVTGLTLNSDVLFNGVRVGTVSRIKISATDPGTVNIRVLLPADTPVREDSLASLAPRGVTGFSLVSISGGTAGSPLLQVPPGEAGVIRATTSPLDAVMQSVPSTIAAANEFLSRLNSLLSQDNIQALSSSFSSVASLASSLAEKHSSLDNALDSVHRAGASFVSLAEKAHLLLADLEPKLRRFSEDGSTAVQSLLQDGRTLLQTLNRIAKQMESNPRRFLFRTDSVKEYPAP